jgi:hypothetical protein
MTITTCLLAAWAASAAAAGQTLGVDLWNDSLSPDAWQCLVQKAEVEWAIVRAQHSTGAFDGNATVNLAHARAAGVRAVDVYMFPCRSKSAASQVSSLMKGLKDASFDSVWIDVKDASFDRISECVGNYPVDMDIQCS